MLALKLPAVQMETSRFGTITVEEKDLLSLPEGMVGFSDCTRFVLLKHKEGSPFFWLQSLDDPGLAFVVTDPRLPMPTYELKLAPDELVFFGVEKPGRELQSWVVVNISKEEPREITANLLAPVVIHSLKRIGKQIILYESSYSIRHPLPTKG